MEIRYKCVIPVIVLVLFFGLILSSCKNRSLQDEETGIIEAEETGEKIEETENDLESVQAELDREESEAEKEALGKSANQMEEFIKVTSPSPNQVISSPLIITGEAVGGWFFEADFPVKLLDGDGEEIAVHYATAESDWMTEDFVPFKATIEFQKPATETGYLVLEKDNPSGLKENDASLIIPVCFE